MIGSLACSFGSDLEVVEEEVDVEVYSSDEEDEDSVSWD